MANIIKRKKCVGILCFSIPLRFSISMTSKEWKEYEKECKYICSPPPLLRLKHKFFKECKVHSAQKLPYYDDEVNEAYKKLCDEFVKCLGADKNKFINWVLSDKNEVHKFAEVKRQNEK